MIKIFKILLFLLFSISIISCSKNAKETIEITSSPEDLYKIAMIELENKNYDIAQAKFKEIEYNYPLSNEAVQSQIMSAFIEYVKMNYQEAIFKFDKIIARYPSHKNIDYTYFMKAMCYYEQISNEYLDGNYNVKALESFNQVINRFPNSKYAKDSQQKIIFVKESIAAKHMDIGRFYLNQKKYLAAMKRYKIVIDDYSTSKFVPEALYRLVEIYYSLGLIEDAKKTASVIGYNYPESKWYNYSYELVGIKNDNNKKNSFFSKVKNLLDKDDEKNK